MACPKLLIFCLGQVMHFSLIFSRIIVVLTSDTHPSYGARIFAEMNLRWSFLTDYTKNVLAERTALLMFSIWVINISHFLY